MRAEDEVEAAADRPMREGETHEFQAEVSRLMDIIINSLYSNKDIFLRELISNGSDAMDKIRFVSLTQPEALGEGDAAALDIRIKVDKETRMVSIRDKGVGMTKTHLVDHLGTIAKSGTAAFLDQMASGGDMSLIGQFGVGFYSVYLVADHVEVITKHNDDEQYIWESKADGSYVITKDEENEPLGRGTEIRIYLKEEMLEYLEESRINELVKRYSEFINYPIYVWTGTESEEEVEIPEEEREEAEEGDEGEEVPTTRMEKVTHYDWERANTNKAIWLRRPSEVEQEDYDEFYKSLSGDFVAPLAHTHFVAEGDVEFKAVLFVPSTAPPDLLSSSAEAPSNLKLYVRRVFISDEFNELMPNYLKFIKGLVDSDSLPLNVSREMLQQHASLKTIKKKLVRKALDMLRKMADDEMYEDEGEEGEEENEGAAMKYSQFWKEYGKAIKLGIIDDSSNRSRLAKLLRFYSSESPDEITSLEEYVERMKEGQKSIYYLACQTQEECATSPFVERLIKEGYEVIYFTDAIDEYVMQSMTEFDDKSFQNASKDDMKLGSTDAATMDKIKDLYKPLTKWWKAAVGSDELESVKVSQRLTTSPLAVVTSKYGWSANMERIMKAQALGQGADQQSYMKSKKTLEINPRHPLIIKLLEKVTANPDDSSLMGQAHLLYESALLESGFIPADAKSFNARLLDSMKGSIGIDSLDVDEDYEFPFPEEEPEEDEPEEDDFEVEEIEAHDEL